MVAIDYPPKVRWTGLLGLTSILVVAACWAMRPQQPSDPYLSGSYNEWIAKTAIAAGRGDVPARQALETVCPAYMARVPREADRQAQIAAAQGQDTLPPLGEAFCSPYATPQVRKS